MVFGNTGCSGIQGVREYGGREGSTCLRHSDTPFTAETREIHCFEQLQWRDFHILAKIMELTELAGPVLERRSFQTFHVRFQIFHITNAECALILQGEYALIVPMVRTLRYCKYGVRFDMTNGEYSALGNKVFKHYFIFLDSQKRMFWFTKPFCSKGLFTVQILPDSHKEPFRSENLFPFKWVIYAQNVSFVLIIGSFLAILAPFRARNIFAVQTTFSG
jgi:hypothetical protein